MKDTEAPVGQVNDYQSLKDTSFEYFNTNVERVCFQNLSLW